jgi:hypothetical protein
MAEGAQPGAGGAPGGLIHALDRASARFNEGLAWAAAALLAAMMLFSVADMVMRGMGRTIAGSYEVIGWMSAAAMALALGTVQRHKGHVAMELFVVRLGSRNRALVEAAMALLSLALFARVGLLRLALRPHPARNRLDVRDPARDRLSLGLCRRPRLLRPGAGAAGRLPAFAGGAGRGPEELRWTRPSSP